MLMFILKGLIFAVGTQKKSVHIENRGVFIYEGVKTSKIHSVGPEGVQYKKVITLEGCSLLGVLLYM
jgi:hypothetical protein